MADEANRVVLSIISSPVRLLSCAFSFLRWFLDSVRFDRLLEFNFFWLKILSWLFQAFIEIQSRMIETTGKLKQVICFGRDLVTFMCLVMFLSGRCGLRISIMLRGVSPNTAKIKWTWCDFSWTKQSLHLSSLIKLILPSGTRSGFLWTIE